MAKIENKTYLRGALILIISNAIVKIIGAIFKIPLTNLIGKEGLGYFSVAYNIYSALFVLSTAGLPVALSKMIAEADALGRVIEVRKIVRVAFSTFAVVGAAASGVMFFGARQITMFIGNASAYPAVLAIAPALFFVSVTSTIRGYYQGLSNMAPTAVSQIIEALCKLVVGFAAAWYVLEKLNMGPEYAAAGAIFGVMLGTALSAVYLLWKKSREKIKIPINSKSLDQQGRSEILRNLIRIALPITIGSSVLSLTNLIDMIVVMNRLQDVGFSETAANGLYGAYNMSLTLFNLPQTLIVAIAITVIPAISAAFARRDTAGASRTIEYAMRMTAILSLPAAAGLSILSAPILNLLYYKRPDDVMIAAPLLTILGFAVLFVAMVSLTNAILQAMGKVNIPVFTMIAGGAVKLVVNYFLVGTSEVNIYGAPVGTTLCYFTITALNFYMIARHSRAKLRFVRIFAKPAASSAAMAVFAHFAFSFLQPTVGGKIAVVAVIAASAAVYLAVLIVSKSLTKNDVILFPKGEMIVKALRLR